MVAIVKHITTAHADTLKISVLKMADIFWNTSTINTKYVNYEDRFW